MADLPFVSILIPVFNERESLIPLTKNIGNVCQEAELKAEILFVNDGSNDGSAEVLDQIFEQDRRVKVIHLRRNFGKAAALTAGFIEAKGEVVITMDADLQDSPSEIPRFIEAVAQGYDMVSGWKYPRLDPVSRRLASRIFNRVTALVTGLKLHDMNCGFKAYRREVVEQLNLYGELHRYIPVMVKNIGYQVGEIKITHQPRRFGKSKYGFWRFFSGFFDLLTVLILTRFRARPLHVFGLIGLALTLIGSGTTLYLIGSRLLGQYLSNRPLFYLGLSLLVVGIQIIFFGLLAEMIAHAKEPGSFFSVKSIRKHPDSEPQDGRQ